MSTDKQAEDGYGLDVQRADVAAYAGAHGHQVIAWHTDEGVSGSNGLDTREALPDALLALKAGPATGLLVPRLDRLSRDMLLQEQLLQDVWAMGREVLSCLGSEQDLRDDPDDPARRMLRQILGAVNEYERSTIVLRLRKGRAAKARRGGYAYGAPPLGLRAEDKELVPDPAEQAAVALILAQHEQGASLREIITALEEGGHRTKRGGRWHPSTVSRTLARSSTAGHGKIPADQPIPRSKQSFRTPRKQRSAPATQPPAPVPASAPEALLEPSAPQPAPAAPEPQPGPACPHPSGARDWDTGRCGACGEAVSD